MERSEPLHPASVEELANIARETGAEVLRGALRYPGDSGSWQLGDIDLSEHLARYRDQELVINTASVGKAGDVEAKQYVCGICGFVMTELGDCPRCKLQVEEGARGLRARQSSKALFQEIDQIVEESWDDSEPNEGEGEHT